MFGMSSRRFGVLVACVALAGLAMPATATAAPAWRLVDLGAGDGSLAYAVNDRNHVVGTDADGAFLWRDGRITDLGAMFPTDINNRDEVVGHRWDGDVAHAVVWRHGKLSDLGVLPAGQSSRAVAINDHGEVVGGANGRAVRWRNGVMSALDSMGREWSVAADINNRGQIVGQVGDFEGVAVRWWRGTVTPLTDRASSPTAVSESGAVTGIHWNAQGSAGFVWQRGRFVELPYFPSPFGENFLEPYGINDRGQVVGNSGMGAFVREHGRGTLLPALTVASMATDINDRGVIVGANPNSPDGLNLHAVLWTR
jgi:probable HAF family extracellular repeat protein